MDGQGAIPTYTPETRREKLEKGLINVLPKVSRIIYGVFYFITQTTKNTITGALRQIFRW